MFSPQLSNSSIFGVRNNDQNITPSQPVASSCTHDPHHPCLKNRDLNQEPTTIDQKRNTFKTQKTKILQISSSKGKNVSSSCQVLD